MENPAEGADDGLSPPVTEPILPLLPGSLARQPGKTLPSRSPRGLRFPESVLEDPDVPEEAKEDLRMVLQNIITVESTLAADDADFLAGSQLDQPGVPGVYTIWLASTVGDTEVSITLGGRTVTNAAIITLRANSEIRENEDTFFQVSSPTGGRPVINVNVVTAAIVRVRVKFLPAMALP